MSEIFLIGVDSFGIRQEQLTLLRKCSLIVASTRLAAHLEDVPVKIIPITPIQKAFTNIEEVLAQGNVAILASGDPLFYGIGGKLIDHFGNDSVRIYPALSSLQEAFASFKMTWSDAAVVSLHGRQAENLASLLLGSPKTFVFTDKVNNPDTIAQKLLAYLQSIGDEQITNGLRMHIAENIGMAEERISSGCLEEIGKKSFSELNVVCLTIPNLPERPTFGLTEDVIIHSRGLITKDEVRAASLHRLALPRKGVLWDIGGGSGSISMEAAAMLPSLSVYIVERKEEEFQNILANTRKFGLFNIVPIKGMASKHLTDLPAPDRVFIGGSGGELESIITGAAAKLKADGRIVVNAVTETTRLQAPEFLEMQGMRVESARIEVSRTGPDGPQRFNPITIMVGRK